MRPASSDHPMMKKLACQDESLYNTDIMMRLQKFLAQAGIASRRLAEKLISSGQIKVNGKVAILGQQVDPLTDEVVFNKKKISLNITDKKIYLALNKPAGYITTRADFKNQKSVYDLLPSDLRSKIWPVGRLDKDSCGLLLFTNDGELTQKLTHPSHQHDKEYLVRHSGQLTEQQRRQLQQGVILPTGKTAPCQIIINQPGELKIILNEGKKRQIREMLRHFRCQVTFLQRTRHGQVKLGNLKEGHYRLLTSI